MQCFFLFFFLIKDGIAQLVVTSRTAARSYRGKGVCSSEDFCFFAIVFSWLDAFSFSFLIQDGIAWLVVLQSHARTSSSFRWPSRRWFPEGWGWAW